MEYVSEKPKTVCVECRSHRAEPWLWFWPGYNHFCHHPVLQKPRKISVVTGESHGRTPHPPDCCDVNTGNCPHFEAI